jgi:hypothetical protein
MNPGRITVNALLPNRRGRLPFILVLAAPATAMFATPLGGALTEVARRTVLAYWAS